MSSFNPYLAGLGDMDVAGLVGVVYRAPRGADETRELEWKTTWDLRPKFRRADLSRHIIGFANRDPDQAARVFGGHAFLLIGVSPGELGSAPELDPADITQMLNPDVGTQLSWHPVYVPFNGARILALVIDPPRWGDPAWRLQRGSEDPDAGRGLKTGTVFVRRPGTTVPADDEDLQRLAARAAVARPELTVALDWNLGRSGNYIGVVVRNGTSAQPALLRQVGFTLRGACEVTDTHPSGEAVRITAFAEFPILDSPGEILPGQELTFRLGLDKSIPPLWDESTDLAPYVYFDAGHWLAGEPQKLIALLQFHGWSNDPSADHMLTSIVLHCIDPPQFKGQTIRSDLRQMVMKS